MTKRHGRGHGHGRKNKRTMRRRRSHSAHLTRSRRHHRHGSRSRARRGGLKGQGRVFDTLYHLTKAGKLLGSSIERNERSKRNTESSRPLPSEISVRRQEFKPLTAVPESMAAKLSKGFDTSRMSNAARVLTLSKSSKPNMGNSPP